MEKIKPELDPLSGGGGSGSLCPYSWVEADGSCFKLFGGGVEEDWKTWPDAEAACQVHGAHLASLASPKQNAAVGGLLAPEEFPECWIGMTDSATEGSWVWSDGEPVIFTSWSGGQPDNVHRGADDCASAATGQDCATLAKSGLWMDRTCEAEGDSPGGEGEDKGKYVRVMKSVDVSQEAEVEKAII